MSRFSDGQHSSFVELIGEPGGCAWTASSTAPWLTFPDTYNSGSNSIVVPYTVAQNVSGGDRTGRIVFSWTGGSTTHFVDQSGSQFISTFSMTDPFRTGGTPTTECHFRSAATPCTFTATSNLPGGGAYTYSWSATYFYGTQKTTTQIGTSNQFSITDACGGTDATAGGNAGDLEVSVTITDSAGNAQTIRSNEGVQPALRIVRFTC